MLLFLLGAFQNFLKMEEFSRRIFLLIYGNPPKSEAIYPKTKIFGEKKSIFENSSGGRPKNQNGRPFSAVSLFFSIILKSMHLSKKVVEPFFKSISWATICTFSELCSSFGSGVITWNVSILGVARSAAHRIFQFSTFFYGLGTFCLSEVR